MWDLDVTLMHLLYLFGFASGEPDVGRIVFRRTDDQIDLAGGGRRSERQSGGG